jgi:hypothetical protein
VSASKNLLVLTQDQPGEYGQLTRDDLLGCGNRASVETGDARRNSLNKLIQLGIL